MNHRHQNFRWTEPLAHRDQSLGRFVPLACAIVICICVAFAIGLGT